jgi:hypothetical protein
MENLEEGEGAQFEALFWHLPGASEDYHQYNSQYSYAR